MQVDGNLKPPKKNKPYKMTPFIRKNRNTIQQRGYLESVSGNT